MELLKSVSRAFTWLLAGDKIKKHLLADPVKYVHIRHQHTLAFWV